MDTGSTRNPFETALHDAMGALQEPKSPPWELGTASAPVSGFRVIFYNLIAGALGQNAPAAGPMPRGPARGAC